MVETGEKARISGRMAAARPIMHRRDLWQRAGNDDFERVVLDLRCQRAADEQASLVGWFASVTLTSWISSIGDTRA